MQTVQIVLDAQLLRAADEAALLTKQNRSALVRDALRLHLRAIDLHAKEERDRAGYVRSPQTEEDFVWDAEAVWPEE